MNSSEIKLTAERHIRDILSLSFKHSDSHAAIVVFDSGCELAVILTQAYRANLPKAQLIDFDTAPPEFILAAFETLKPLDLVVLIQSTNFRLNAFRIRVELFKREIKAIEHVHLARMPGTQAERYIDSLAYDASYYRGVGAALKKKIDQAAIGIVDSDGEQLIFEAGFEQAKLNVGDYTGMKNIGGQFPIGEVFTESKDLERVNGRVRVFAFGDSSFTVNTPEKHITLVVEKGRVVQALDSTPEFDKVLEQIRAEEGEVWLRELGFGMNRAFTRERRVDDIGTYERMCGVHLSMGAKHTIYKKPQFTINQARHHVDVFAETKEVTLDGESVYLNGAWRV
ncbi:MAG TPA: hypothetical protein DIS66_06810 [Candidatus Omnitrophica bacterium]|nr:hypothetical protein [Candidatus Omnitrophota bacterium]